MWWWPAFAGAVESGVPGEVTLWVGVPLAAGTVADVAADGAAGQCAMAPSRITCPAAGPVTFRWGPGGERAIVGDAVLSPGEAGVAWALTPAEAADLERWRADARTAADPMVRREALFLLRPWTWAAGTGPLPATSPPPIPVGFLFDVAGDPAWAVRRALVELVRDLRDPDGRYGEETEDVLLGLLDDGDKRVAKGAYAALAEASRTDRVPPEEAWIRAFEAVDDPGPRGRSASLALAKLSTVLEPGGDVDPAEAIEHTLAAHPEQAWRVWAAWRAHVPFRADWAQILLQRTTNLNRGLLRQWADDSPAALAAAIVAWEPSAPHSERFRVVREWLADAKDPALRAALAL